MISSLQKPRQEYDKLASRYDRRWARYVELSSRETLRRSPLAPSMHILDVGCGTGALLAAVLGSQPDVIATGVDISERMLRVAADKPDISGRLVCADAQSLPFVDTCFDLVLSVSILHYLPCPRDALVEAGRILKPGGRLVITDWCHDFLACRVLSVLLPLMGKAHMRTYRAHECRRLLSQTGFDVVSLDTYKITPFWGLMTAVARRAPA